MKWISGQNLLSKWHIQKADFFEIVLLDRELQPYDWKGAPVNVDIYSDSLDISRKLKKFFEEQPLMEGLRTQEAKHAALCAQIGNDLLDCRYLHTEVRDFESRYPPLTGASEPSADAAATKAGLPGRKPTRLTPKAKERLKEIVPVVKGFCQKLSAWITLGYGTVTHIEADSWQQQALYVLEDEDTWKEIKEIMGPADVHEIDFKKHAGSEHKERLGPELAQIILEREGFGKVSRKTLAQFF